MDNNDNNEQKKKNAVEIRDIGNLEITVNLPMRNDESQEDIQEQLLQQMRRFTEYCEAIGDSLRGDTVTRVRWKWDCKCILPPDLDILRLLRY